MAMINTTQEKADYFRKSYVKGWFTFREYLTLVFWLLTSKRKRDLFWSYASMGMHCYGAFDAVRRGNPTTTTTTTTTTTK